MKLTSNKVAAMCAGKEAFDTPQIAHEVVKKRLRRGIKVEAYRCHVCARWHLGNNTASKAARQRMDERRARQSEDMGIDE